MGTVAPTVNTPHGLPASAFTTTNDSTASIMVMIPRIAIRATNPAVVFSSSFTICPSDLPSRRIEQNRITKSCTAPPRVAPIRIHSVPGR